MTVTIWHNPRCSTSRRTLEQLRENGIEPEIRLYLDTPPDKAELKAALALLRLPAIALVRTKEARFAELGLTRETSRARLITAMAKNPVLIERPLVFAGGRAALGRPPEAVLAILRPDQAARASARG